MAIKLLEADINAAASGDNTIIAAVSTAELRIRKIFIVATGAVNIKFKDGASTDLNAFAIPLTAAGSSMTLYNDDVFHWTTTKGNAFIINLSAAVQITGRVYYERVGS